jgi:hypothetical protein
MACGRESAKKTSVLFLLAVLVCSPLTVYPESLETTESTDAPVVSTDAIADVPPPAKDTGAQSMALASGGTSFGSSASLNSLMQIRSNFVGSATYSVPIEVPPYQYDANMVRAYCKFN